MARLPVIIKIILLKIASNRCRSAWRSCFGLVVVNIFLTDFCSAPHDGARGKRLAERAFVELINNINAIVLILYPRCARGLAKCPLQ